MVKYYFQRVLQKTVESLDTFDTISIDYLSEEVAEGDIMVLFVSHILDVVGIYRKQGDVFVAERVFEPTKRPNLRNYYQYLSFVEFVGARTYKLFAKKTREVQQTDVDLFRK